jgi:hypothetical protein
MGPLSRFFSKLLDLCRPASRPARPRRSICSCSGQALHDLIETDIGFASAATAALAGECREAPGENL